MAFCLILTFNPRPDNVKQLKQFYGLASYFRRYILHFDSIAAPLNKLL